MCSCVFNQPNQPMFVIFRFPNSQFEHLLSLKINQHQPNITSINPKKVKIIRTLRLINFFFCFLVSSVFFFIIIVCVLVSYCIKPKHQSFTAASSPPPGYGNHQKIFFSLHSCPLKFHQHNLLRINFNIHIINLFSYCCCILGLYDILCIRNVKNFGIF